MNVRIGCAMPTTSILQHGAQNPGSAFVQGLFLSRKNARQKHLDARPASGRV
jgi:hypothetical protein